MSKDVEQLAEELAELAARIEAKVKEFDEQGVLHGPPRKAAASLKMQQERERLQRPPVVLSMQLAQSPMN